MDARLTTEQQDLRNAAARLADDLGPGSVSGLADTERVARLEKAVAAAGWRKLRSDGASAVEVALVAEEFGRGLVDVAFLGPVLADDLRRGAGLAADDPPVTIAVNREAVDARGIERVLALDGNRVLAGWPVLVLGGDAGTDVKRRALGAPVGVGVPGAPLVV